jgi:UDP-2-acetamido-3-amino-2,3-dideoxy-glucuronate N-acetyltransferase
MIASTAFVHASSFADSGCSIGEGTKIWHFSHIMSDAEIGSFCNIGQNVFIASGVKIGDRTKIQNNVSLYTGVVCEEDVFLGPSMVFTNVMNPRAFVERKSEYRPTISRKGASIGANATLVCGNEIGEFAFVAAGAVVTQPVLNFSMVAGVPAKHIGWMSKAGHKLHFDENNQAQCPETGQTYVLRDQQCFGPDL